MEAAVYDGYFNNGLFYVAGKTVQIPEKQRVIITVFYEMQNVEDDAMAAWLDIKRMIIESKHENDLLTEDVFFRDKSNRNFIDFSNEEPLS